MSTEYRQEIGWGFVKAAKLICGLNEIQSAIGEILNDGIFGGCPPGH